jgi:3-isopropylmalate dehydratase small subunit
MDAFEQRVLAADGAAPFTADLRSQTLSGPGGADLHFDMSAADRTRLLEGLDEIGMSLKNADAIAAWEAHMRSTAPWLQTAVRRPGTEPTR